MLLPLVWLLFESGLVWQYDSVTYVLFNVMLFVDGLAVALSSVLDIDLCGLDIVSATCDDVTVGDDLRNWFNTRQVRRPCLWRAGGS